MVIGIGFENDNILATHHFLGHLEVSNQEYLLLYPFSGLYWGILVSEQNFDRVGTLSRVVGQANSLTSSRYMAKEMGHPQPKKTEPPASLSQNSREISR